MGLKINPEIQITYSSVLEAQVVQDIAEKLMGVSIYEGCESHFKENILTNYCDSRDVRLQIKDGRILLRHDTEYRGIKMNFQEFIEYAAKQPEVRIE